MLFLPQFSLVRLSSWFSQLPEPVVMKQYSQCRKKSRRSFNLLGCIEVHGIRYGASEHIEKADDIARLLSVMFEGSWQLMEVPEDWRNAVTPDFKKDEKEDIGDFISFTTDPVKLIDQILWEIILKYI